LEAIRLTAWTIEPQLAENEPAAAHDRDDARAVLAFQFALSIAVVRHLQLAAARPRSTPGGVARQVPPERRCILAQSQPELLTAPKWACTAELPRWMAGRSNRILPR
jgi:hypothetical protein